MHVTKRNGTTEALDFNKIQARIARESGGLNVDPDYVAQQTIEAVVDGISTTELDWVAIRRAANLTLEDPDYDQLAVNLLCKVIEAEVGGWVSKIPLYPERDRLFDFFGLKTLYDRYLRRDGDGRLRETPQLMFSRVAQALTDNFDDAVELYDLMSNLHYLPSSPTLFNAGTDHPQMSSCYLLDSPEDDLASIYETYSDVAQLSKWAGGIGLSYSRVRSEGSPIEGTGGQSNGIIPWLNTLDASVAAVNQGGKRKGAAAVYLEPWHADIESFLEIKDNTGDHDRRAHHLNTALWIPDLFMKAVRSDMPWYLMDPAQAPELVDLWGGEFEDAYHDHVDLGHFCKKVSARDLYRRMCKAAAETGNFWFCFKNAANMGSPQTYSGEYTIHSSNLCTEILEVTDADSTAVCNLGSINLANCVVDGEFDFDLLAERASKAVKYLDSVIDRNFYPTAKAGESNRYWRPIGLGYMGLQDVFFKLGIPFDSRPARELSEDIASTVYAEARAASEQLAEDLGPAPCWEDGTLTGPAVRNSLLIAVAPNATLSTIAGVTPNVEPQASNLDRQRTLSGEFIRVNRYLQRDAMGAGVWGEVLEQLKSSGGSVAGRGDVHSDLYQTAWEIPNRALIDMQSDRVPWVDQSVSLNLFMADPTIDKVASMYMHAWEQGLKTTYYLRSQAQTSLRDHETCEIPETDDECIVCN